MTARPIPFTRPARGFEAGPFALLVVVGRLAVSEPPPGCETPEPTMEKERMKEPGRASGEVAEAAHRLLALYGGPMDNGGLLGQARARNRPRSAPSRGYQRPWCGACRWRAGLLGFGSRGPAPRIRARNWDLCKQSSSPRAEVGEVA